MLNRIINLSFPQNNINISPRCMTINHAFKNFEHLPQTPTGYTHDVKHRWMSENMELTVMKTGKQANKQKTTCGKVL